MNIITRNGARYLALRAYTTDYDGTPRVCLVELTPESLGTWERRLAAYAEARRHNADLTALEFYDSVEWTPANLEATPLDADEEIYPPCDTAEAERTDLDRVLVDDFGIEWIATAKYSDERINASIGGADAVAAFLDELRNMAKEAI